MCKDWYKTNQVVWLQATTQLTLLYMLAYKQWQVFICMYSPVRDLVEVYNSSVSNIERENNAIELVAMLQDVASSCKSKKKKNGFTERLTEFM